MLQGLMSNTRGRSTKVAWYGARDDDCCAKPET